MNGAIAAWKRLLETNPDYPQRDRVQQLIAQAEQHVNVRPGTKTDKPAQTAQISDGATVDGNTDVYT